MNIWSIKSKLKVPYIPQINENACGAAVLVMVYKYYGLKNIFQEDLFKKYQELEPHGSGNFRFSADSLVSDALTRGFLAFWARADFTNRNNTVSLLELLIRAKIPIIVCQKFTNGQPMIGHFRIVVGIKDNIIYVHDPHVELGGAYKEWEADKFLEYWQPTGQNITGGVFVVIKNL